MTNDTYIINSVDDLGNANITYQVWDSQYTQDLMNLPVDTAESLKAALDTYVAEAKTQLAPTGSATPAPVADLVGTTQQVS